MYVSWKILFFLQTDYTYFTDLRAIKIFRVNKITGGQKRTIYTWQGTPRYTPVSDLKYFNASIQTGKILSTERDNFDSLIK